MKPAATLKLMQKLALLALLSFLTASCAKDNGGAGGAPSDLSTITNFTIKKANNESLSEDGYVSLSGSNIYITLPKGSQLTSVKVNLTLAANAKAKIGNNELNVGAPITIDLSNTVSVDVFSESGKKRTYYLLAQEGLKNIDQMIYDFMAKHSVPGVSYAISRNEQVVYKAGAGFAITENLVRTQPSYLYRLGSISKSFTSVCIMKLHEQKRLSIDDKVFGVDGILGAEFGPVSAMAASVTVKHLLEHSSGWSNGSSDPLFSSSAGLTIDDKIAHILKSSQLAPGTKHTYYNMGFVILGRVIEKVTGKVYEAYLKEVLAEAGITDVHIGGDKLNRRANEVAYYSQGTVDGYANQLSIVSSAGGIIASAEEMLKLLAHIDGKNSVPDILKPETRALMLTPSAAYNRYALGWRVNHPSYFSSSAYHGGTLSGTATLWVMGPDVSCVILCNSRSYSKGIDDDMYDIARAMMNNAPTTSW